MVMITKIDFFLALAIVYLCHFARHWTRSRHFFVFINYMHCFVWFVLSFIFFRSSSKYVLWLFDFFFAIHSNQRAYNHCATLAYFRFLVIKLVIFIENSKWISREKIIQRKWPFNCYLRWYDTEPMMIY